MRRRQFVQATLLTLAAGASGGCAGRVGALSGVASSNASEASACHAARRFADTPSGRIAYIDRGRGEVALFLHGFPLNAFQWRGAIDRLSSRRRCVAPDFMGLGFSEIPDGQRVTPDAQVTMLAQLLDSLSISTVDVIANDSGGAVAQLFVLKYPRRVRTMLLTNCDVEPDSPPPALLPVIEMARAGTFADQWLAPWLANKALARSSEGIGGMCYSDPTHPTDEAIECYFGPLLSSPRRKTQLHAYALGLDPNPLAGIESALRRCTVPTRIVWGVDDTIFSAASPDYLDRILPNSLGVRRLANAKLFFPEEYPEVLAEEAHRLWEKR